MHCASGCGGAPGRTPALSGRQWRAGPPQSRPGPAAPPAQPGSSTITFIQQQWASVLRIRDVYPGFRIRLFSIPDPNCLHPGSRIRIKEFKYFNPKKWFPSSRKYYSGCSSRIPDPDADFLPIPDPGVKKAPDPGSATLVGIYCVFYLGNQCCGSGSVGSVC